MALKRKYMLYNPCLGKALATRDRVALVWRHRAIFNIKVSAATSFSFSHTHICTHTQESSFCTKSSCQLADAQAVRVGLCRALAGAIHMTLLGYSLNVSPGALPCSAKAVLSFKWSQKIFGNGKHHQQTWASSSSYTLLEIQNILLSSLTFALGHKR